VALVFDSKLPPPFRKDLKNLIKNRLDGLSVPIELRESVIAFPTPRPQPQAPREMPFGYPPPREPERAAPPPPPAASPAPPVAPPEGLGARGIAWIVAIALCILGALIGALAVALLSA